jgi:hypothetical protein
MKCYNHHDRDAFGIAFLTGKGLCLECAEEYKRVLIEKGDEQAKLVIDKMLSSYKVLDMERQRQSMKIFSYLFWLMGIAFILFGLSSLFNENVKFDPISTILGVIFFILGFAYNKFYK